MAGHNVLRMGTLATGQDDVGLPGEHVAQNDHRMTGGGRRNGKKSQPANVCGIAPCYPSREQGAVSVDGPRRTGASARRNVEDSV